MKIKLLFFLVFPFSLFSQNPFSFFSQQEDYSDFHMTYSQTQDIQLVSDIKNNTKISSYTTKDGLKIEIGDTLIIGKALTERKKYMLDDTFSHIVVGKIQNANQKDFTFLPHGYSEENVIVQSIFVTHERYTGYNPLAKRKEMPLYVSVFVKSPKSDINSLEGISKMLSISRKTILDIEKALSSGEVFNPNTPFTREEAINKLKESKDLMDIGLLSKEKYEELKKQLTPIIMDK